MKLLKGRVYNYLIKRGLISLKVPFSKYINDVHNVKVPLTKYINDVHDVKVLFSKHINNVNVAKVSTNPQMRNTTNLLILNLAVADLGQKLLSCSQSQELFQELKLSSLLVYTRAENQSGGIGQLID